MKLYDIVFVDIPLINYERNDELDSYLTNYYKECNDIIWKLTGVNAVEKSNYYSMGILCLSSYLKESIEKIKVGYINYYLNINEFSEYVKNTSVLAFSTMTITMNTIIKLAYDAYKINPKLRIVLGGYHASYCAHSILENCSFIDCVFLFEGEQSLLEYVTNKRKETISGVAFRNEKGEIVINPFRKYLKNSKIPSPDYSLIVNDIKEYNIQLSTMRGCVGACNFCVNKSYWSCPRLIPVNSIVDELMFLKENLNKDTVIHIIDNNFTYNKSRLKKLYEVMKKNNLIGYFKFECDTLSSLIDEETVDLLEKIGVFKIGIGIEDCDNLILRNANKPSTFELNVNSAKIIKRVSDNICVYAYWIIGLPGSTIESLEKNLEQMKELIENNIIDIVSPKIFIPYPGTSYFDEPNKYGIMITSYNWDLYERRNPPFPFCYDNLTDIQLYDYLLKSFKTCHESYLSKNKDQF
ncbi:MAG: radical SAM protein [Ruminococcus sp.]|nr:radical SAM protein [Ruminococcus sp.]